MKIYAKTETSFNNNGLGFLTDVIEAKITENLNGDMYLELQYPIGAHNSDLLVEDNIIKCDTGSDNEQLFRIKRVIKTYTKISVYAPHIFYDLGDNFLLDTAPTGLDAQSFGNWILQRTNFQNSFTFQSDISGTKSARYVRRNPIEAIIGDIENSMINLFGGDLERDNFTIKLLSHRGSQNENKLIFGKNIKEIKITIDTTSIITRILPLGFDGLTIPETYVDSPLISDYITPRIAKAEFQNIKYDPEADDAYHTIEEAQEALRIATNNLYNQGVDKPTINIKIDWLELSKTEEYKNYTSLETLHIGDEITAEILGINYSTRITKTKYNVLTKEIENFEIGTIQKTITSAVNANQTAIDNVPISSMLETARNNATEQITQAMGGYVYKTQNELYIMDAPTPAQAQKVWRWNLNGLAYSATGINGTYQVAMTQDGQIVADMVTTGTMSADRITGLNGIIFNVGQLGDHIEITQNGEMIFHAGTDDYSLKIENNGIAIYQGTTRLSYWYNQQMTVPQINMGAFSFIPRSNGSLGFRKTGGTI